MESREASTWNQKKKILFLSLIRFYQCSKSTRPSKNRRMNKWSYRVACYLTSFPVICGGVDPSHSGLLRLSKGNAGDLIRSGCAGMFGDHVFGSDAAASPPCATHAFNSRFMRQWKVCSGCWCWWRLYWGLYCITSWPSSPPASDRRHHQQPTSLCLERSHPSSCSFQTPPPRLH